MNRKFISLVNITLCIFLIFKNIRSFQNDFSFGKREKIKIIAEEKTSQIKSEIVIVYAVEGLLEISETSPSDSVYIKSRYSNVFYTLRQSIHSIFYATKDLKEPKSKKIKVFLFFCDDYENDKISLEKIRNETELKFFSENVDILIRSFNSSLVTKKRKVWGYKGKSISNLKKLESSSNYLRYYLPNLLLAEGVKKFLYVDYDVMFSSGNGLFDIFGKFANGNVTLAAGEQENCKIGDIIDVEDSRIVKRQIDSKHSCMASAIMLINSHNWVTQNRLENLEYWLFQNEQMQMWSLGSLPPLIIEFENQWEKLPRSLVRDNKGYKVASSINEAIIKNITMLHPFKKRNFLGRGDIWFQVTISTADDMTLLYHVLHHYYKLGIQTHYFLIILHHDEKKSIYIEEARIICEMFGVYNIMYWTGPYSSRQMHANRKRFRKELDIQAEDWIVHADSDQLHEFPDNNAPYFLRMASDLGYDSIYGYYVDRVSTNGALLNITTRTSLFEQFPLSCYMSTKVVVLNQNDADLNIPTKIMAFKGKLCENQGGGTVQDERKICAFPARLNTHHFKWNWGVLRKMTMREEAEKEFDWVYQATNVLKHIKENNGKIDIKDTRLNCRIEEKKLQTLVSSIPVNKCAKYNYIDKERSSLE